MNDNADNGRNIRRIAIAFDPTLSPPALLEAAADLAVAFGAELEALFVEDADIASLSGLPFARLFEPSSGKSVRFDESARAARRAGPVARNRMALRQLAERRRITYTVREFAGGALATAAEQCSAELIVFASHQTKFGGPARIDEEVLRIASTARRSVLLAAGFPISAGRILVVASDDALGRRAGNIAGRIAPPAAAGDSLRFETLLPGDLTRAEIAERIEAYAPTLLIIGVPDADLVDELCHRLRPEDCSVLVVR